MTPATVQEDEVTAQHRNLLAALLDHDVPPWDPNSLPPLGHWLLFPPAARQSSIGEDGHPRRTMAPGDVDFGLPRRMWAGGRLRFHAPLRPGMTVRRESEQLDVTRKQGQSGDMAFVVLRHHIFAGDTLLIEEEQDLVYRQAAQPGASATPASSATPTAPLPVARSLSIDPVQLFRFSALTFNAHRIHYDRGYAMEAEGYPGLVVHGPFTATLLMDHYLRQAGPQRIATFAFRAMRPLFDGEPFTLGLANEADGAVLQAIGPSGGLAMDARVGVS